MKPIKKILVLGGTGFVGRSVCEKLVERGAGSGSVRVPTRRMARGQLLRALPTVEVVEADVHDAAQLQRLLVGVDAVINLIAILHGNEKAFERAHVTLPQTLASACAAAGVRRLVHVSALGVGPQAPSNYLRSKTRGEAVLQAAGLDLTMLRPSVIFGAEDRFLNVFASLQSVAPLMPLAGSGARFQPVWVEDVASAIVGCLDQPATIGQVYECCGPGVYTLSELVRLAGRWSGNERMQIPLPEFVGMAQAFAMELLPGEPLMSRDNVASMRQPNIATPKAAGLEALGITATALEAVAPSYLSDTHGRARLNRWRAGARRT